MDRPTRGRMTCPTRLPDPPVGTLVTPPTSTPRIPAPPGTSPPITTLAQSRWFASFFSVAGGLVFEDSFGVLLPEGDDLSLLDHSSVRIAARSIQRFEVIRFGDLIRISIFGFVLDRFWLLFRMIGSKRDVCYTVLHVRPAPATWFVSMEHPWRFLVHRTCREDILGSSRFDRWHSHPHPSSSTLNRERGAGWSSSPRRRNRLHLDPLHHPPLHLQMSPPTTTTLSCNTRAGAGHNVMRRPAASARLTRKMRGGGGQRINRHARNSSTMSTNDQRAWDLFQSIHGRSLHLFSSCIVYTSAWRRTSKDHILAYQIWYHKK
jgi:hypothetical protein